MKKAIFLALIFASTAVWAQEQSSEGQSKMKVEDAADQKNKVKDGDIDKEITNPRMRADIGSKSRHSLNMGLNYSGGGLRDPFAADRPDIYDRPNVQLSTGMDASVSYRYRFNKNDALSFGTSFGARTPFQGHVNQREDQFNVGDPGLSFIRAFGTENGWMHQFAIGASAGTSIESRRQDMVWSPAASYTLIKAFKNGLNIGLSTGLDYNFYSSDAGENPNTIARREEQRQDYAVRFFPFLEYVINDTFQFRTVSRYTSFYHRLGDDNITGGNHLSLMRERGSQSAGLGISVSRDIWVYPNLQWAWQTPANRFADTTNVGISSIINVF